MPQGRLGVFAAQPITFLVTHGWELSLKAFLRASGMSERALAGKTFGHRLDNLLSEAERHGLSEHFQMSAEGDAVFDQITYAAERHEARYLNLDRPRIIDFNFKPLIDDGLRFYRAFVGEGDQCGRDWYSAEQQSIP